MQIKTQGIKGAKKLVLYDDELSEKLVSLFDDDSVVFLKNHRGITKAGSAETDSSLKTSVNLVDLIDLDQHIPPSRLIHYKEGIAQLKLLLFTSSQKDIQKFHKKLKEENVIDPDNPDYSIIFEIINQYASNSLEKKRVSFPKIDMESLECLKKITNDSLKKNYKRLVDAKEEYHYYKERVDGVSSLYSDKLKGQLKAKREVSKVEAELKKVEELRKLLLLKKNRLRHLKKRIDLYSKHFSQEGKPKLSKNATLLSKVIGKEKNKFLRMVESYKKEKKEVEKVSLDIQKFSKIKTKICKNYSELDDELKKIKCDIEKDTAYQDCLEKEVASLGSKIKTQQSELQCMGKIAKSYKSLESYLVAELEPVKRGTEIQGKIFNRYSENKNDIHLDFDKSKYIEDFGKITASAETLYGELNTLLGENQKLLKRAVPMGSKMLQAREKCKEIKNGLLEKISQPLAVKLRKEIRKNMVFLGKVESDFEELEKNQAALIKDKESKLSSLKELGRKHNSLIGRWRVYADFSGEGVRVNENLLLDPYGKLTAMKIELASTYEIFSASCVNNDNFRESISSLSVEIECLRTEIVSEIQEARECLVKEESDLGRHEGDQQIIKNKNNSLNENFKELSLNKDDIEILLCLNADLEKMLNDLCIKKWGATSFEKKSFNLSASLNSMLSGLKSGYEKATFKKIGPGLMSRFVKIESLPLSLSGLLVFLFLGGFSYLVIHNLSFIYEGKEFTRPLSSEMKKANPDLNRPADNPVSGETNQLRQKNNPPDANSLSEISSLQSNSINIIPFPMIPGPKEADITKGLVEEKELIPGWDNYSDIFKDLRFDDPKNAFWLFEMMMNKKAIDLKFMDSVQLLYSIKNVLYSGEGPFFDRLYNDFVELGFDKKDAASSLLHNNRLIEKKYNNGTLYIFKDGARPIAVLEEMSRKDFLKIMAPYIVSNYKIFAKYRKEPVPENIKDYARNLAHDIYESANKFKVPVTSMIAIAHQESFFINLLGDGGKSASPFQIYEPTKRHILNSLKRDGFKIPGHVKSLENHVTLATFMAAYHFSNLMKKYATSIIDPLTRKPTTLIVDLEKSIRAYNGGKPYKKNVLLKQRQLEKYLKNS